MLRAIGMGTVVLLVVALVYASLRGILDLTTGTIAVATAGGWAIGAAVRAGAWGGEAHRPSRRPVVAAMSLGAACWLACLVGAWLVAMAILPGSSRTFLERLAGTQFLDWLTPQLGLADLLDLVLFVTLAWVGSRSAATIDDGVEGREPPTAGTSG